MPVVANGIDVVAARNQSEANETSAVYDPAAKAISVRALPITLDTKAQLVRELSRALDDQAAGIARPQYATDAHESAFTFAAVVDGDAARIRDAWVASLPKDQQDAYAALVQQAHAASRVSGLNPAFIDLIDGPATAGEPFVKQLLTAAPDRFASSLATPPLASAQVLHPDRFLSGFVPTDVPVPDAPGNVIDKGVFGEQLTALVLSASIPEDEADAAADGWKGDSYALWQSGGAGACVTIHYVMDSPDEAQELGQAFSDWSKTRGGVQIDDSNGRGSDLMITACGGASSGRSPL
jgi:hypothetical protein